METNLRTKIRTSVNRTPLTYTVYFERDSEVGGYTVTCPALNGVTTEGDTIVEARRMITEGIVGYVEWLLEDGEPIPKDKPTRAGRRQEKIRFALNAV